MGVSILMRPGTIMRSKGDPVNITQGFRSRAASVIRGYFGESPCEIDRDHLDTLRKLEAGASIYTNEGDNIWAKIGAAVHEHDCVVIVMEY